MSRPLRVATIVTRFQAGAGAVALHGALGLDPGRFQVSISAGSGDRLLDDARSAGLPVHVEPSLRSPIDPVHDLLALRRLSTLLAGGDFDVVHTHSAKAGTIGRLAARRAGVPRIVHTFHGFPFHEFQSAARRNGYIGIERRLGRFTDVALCVGTGVASEAVRRRLLPPERIRTIGVISGARPPADLALARATARRQLGLTASDRVVGAVGRLAYQKAPEHFLAALARLNRRDVVGVWVGGGELAEQVAAEAARLAPQVRVLLTGERSDVLELLPAFDVFALPSRYEGVPVALVEAAMCGVPIVATAVNGVCDVVVPGSTGLLVPPQRPDLLARAVDHLLDHPATAERLAREARKQVASTHTDKALAVALMAAYTDGTHRGETVPEFLITPTTNGTADSSPARREHAGAR
jgi:glycosyltransferase involved in cell wall biosynthesis